MRELAHTVTFNCREENGMERILKTITEVKGDHLGHIWKQNLPAFKK